LVNSRQLPPYEQFLTLLGASCGLYLSGMVFNDVFDRQQDAVERPNRPIPSSRVPLRNAILLGAALMLGGVAAAAMVTPPTLYVAGLLAATIFLYDFALKRTPLGPIAMGSCRFLNVMLGAAGSYDRWFQLWARPQLVCAIGLGVYIIGVTWFARTEAKQSNRGQLSVALVTLNAGLGVLVWLICTWPNEARPELALMLLAMIAGSMNFRAIAAIRDASPPRVQGMIKLFLLNYVTICATLVYWHTNNSPLALGTACLVIPALLLSRVIPMT
jgi:4-hydroxybenzoate polyprenyltransferase